MATIEISNITLQALENFCIMMGIEGSTDDKIERLIYKCINVHDLAVPKDARYWRTMTPREDVKARVKLTCRGITADKLLRLYDVLCPGQPFRSWDWYLNQLGALAVYGLKEKPEDVESLFRTF
jgi:hypothetical protein